AGQRLQHQTRDAPLRAFQNEAGRQLLRLCEIGLETIVDARADERHDALEEPVRAVHVDVHGEPAAAEPGLADRTRLALRHAAHAEIFRALDQQQLQRAFALQLDRHARLGLETAREQHRRRDALAEQTLEVRRVGVQCYDLLPGFFEPHERAANSAALEQKALHFVHYR